MLDYNTFPGNQVNQNPDSYGVIHADNHVFECKKNAVKRLRLTSSSLIATLIILTIFFTGIGDISAQSIPGDWQEPTNLSNSGSASDPQILTAPNGVVHTMWKDDYADLVYRRFDGTWSAPSDLDLPFARFDFRIVGNLSGDVIAVWIDSGDNNLYYSSVQEEAMSRTESWNAQTLLASGAVSFDIEVDVNNVAHLIYARGRDSSDNPAGIYYRNSPGSLANWSSSRLVYQSKYYRSLLPAPGNAAASFISNKLNVRVSSGQTNAGPLTVLSWENPSLKKLFFTRSSDGGNNWEEPQEVSSPTQESALITPRDLMTIFLGNTSLQIWSLSEPGGNCGMVYRTNSDSNTDWSSPQSLEQVFGSCPDGLRWKNVDNKEIVFFIDKQNSVSLVAWNGTQWSQPQNENQINQFSNPITLDLITFSQLSTGLVNSTIYLVGKDEGGSGDIWVTSKQLEDTGQWYGNEASWSSPEVFSLDNPGVRNISFLDNAGKNFWFVVTGPTSNEGRSFLAVQNVLDSGPSTFVTVLDNIDGGTHQMTAMTVPAVNRASFLWSGGRFGELYYAWVDLTQTSNPVGWSNPTQLQSRLSASSPDIINAGEQSLFAVFSSPVSSSASLFWISSQNGGETWSDPTAIPSIDDLSEQCPVIRNPQVIISNDTNIQVIFTCETFTQGSGSLGLYGVNSSSNGSEWSQASLISDLPVTWATLLVDSSNVVHRIYKVESGETSLFHSFSSDDGLTWSSPAKFALMEDPSGPTSAVLDSNRHIHVIQTSYTQSGAPELFYYRWTGSEWTTLDALDLNSVEPGRIQAITSGIARNNSLEVGMILNTRKSDLQKSMIITSKYTLGNSEAVVNEDPITVSQPTAVVGGNEDVEPTPTMVAEPTFVPGSLNSNPSSSSSSTGGIIVGILISAIFIVVSIFFIRRKA